MNFDEYQKQSRITAGYKEAGDNFTYPLLGLVGEAGEVADKVKKHMRDEGKYHPSELNDEQRLELAKELGDVLWYLAQLSTEIGFDLSEVAQLNIDKTHSRMNRGKLGGSGDNR